MSFDDKEKLVLFLAVALAVLIYLKRASSRSLPLPPGPKRLPLIGNLLNVPRNLEWESYERWGKEFSAYLLVIFRRTWRLTLIRTRFGHHLPQCRWLGGRRPEFTQRGERAAR